MTPYNPPEMYDIVFRREVGGDDAVPVTSVVFGENGRPINYGLKSNGQSFKVALQDIIAKPNTFLAPCGQPYRIVGATVEDPCQTEVPPPSDLESAPTPVELPKDLKKAASQFKTAFGSEEASEALILAGHTTLEAVAELGDGELRTLVGAGPASAYRKWAAKESGEASNVAKTGSTTAKKGKQDAKPD